MSILARAQITIVVINDGPTGPTGKRMLTGMVHYQLSNASAPDKPSATAFNLATREFTGLTANWAIDSPVYASGNANKYWYCTYTVEESASGSGTGTPIFGTVKQAIGFSGLVTFTGDQAVSDGTKTLSFGASGATKIDGGNIETGTVSADRIDVDNLVAKQVVIGKIQDVAGPLASTAKSEAISAAATDASTKATAAETEAKAYADTQLGNFATTVTGSLSDLQSQIDGNITTWFYAYVPTTANAPASGWTTTALKNQHLGDLFYDTETGFCYRYQLVSSVYSWQRITDSDVTKALADAAEAKDTADSKRRVFVATPVTPYDIGDLWLNNQELYKCKVTRLTGSYVASDWEKGVKYTDDTVANANLVTAKAYADTKKAEAIEAAEAAAEAEALAAQTAAEAHADGIVTAEEAARIADVNDKLATAKTYAETKATEAKNAAEAAAAALDDAIQIGGRNYFRHLFTDTYNGSSVQPVNGWYVADTGQYGGIIFSTAYLEEGNTYTISFEYKTTDNSGWYSIASPRSAFPTKYNSNKTLNLITDGKVHKKVLQITATATEEVSIVLVRAASSGTVYYKENSLKVEKGNKATDWTPAPEDVQAEIDAASAAAAAAQSAADDAQDDADAANALLTNIASDSKLTASEKQAAQKEWDIIQAEKTKNDTQADLYSVSKTVYTNAYNALNSYLPTLLSNLTTTSNITGSEFRGKFKDYYNARTDLLNAISNAAKAAAEATAAALDDAIQVGGRNLITDTLNYGNTVIYDNRGVVLSTGYNKFTYQNQVGVIAGPILVFSENLVIGNPYTLSFKFVSNIETTLNYVRLRSGATRVNFGTGVQNFGNQTIGIGENLISLTFYSESSDINGLWLAINITSVGTFELSNLKIEAGNKATDWTPAPEDVDADATAKAAAARAAAEATASGLTNTAKNALAAAAGYTDYDDMVAKADLTVNGLLNSNIINTDQIFADKLLAFSAFINNLTVRKLLTPVDSLNARVEIKEPTTADPYARINITGSDIDSVWNTYLKMYVESIAESGLESPSAAFEIITNWGTANRRIVRVVTDGLASKMLWNVNNPAASGGRTGTYNYEGITIEERPSGGDYAAKIKLLYNLTTSIVDFILDGLPTSNPGGSVTVWKDAKGFLRIGAAVAYTAADVGAVPTTRKVNNKALSADISLTAADVGALPANTIQYFTQAQWAALTQAQKDAVPLALVQE